MALDQRYCLHCGNRRGDPRLPFMDAVTFMEASKQPQGSVAATAPPPAPARSGISPSTTLIAGIATLVLAVGVGVLIGRGGGDSAPVAQQPKTQVIQVGGGPTAESGEPSEAAGGGKGAKGGKKASKSNGGKKAKKAPENEVGASGTSKAAEEVLKPSADAKPLPPPTTKVGESCAKGTAGCSDSGEFNGSFFE
jgi:hypothetical protein